MSDNLENNKIKKKNVYGLKNSEILILQQINQPLKFGSLGYY